MQSEHDAERPVIEAIREGDSQAMAELIHRHGRWVRGVIFGLLGRADEVDDVAQRVWMRFWREARRLEDPDRWRVWLYRTARNAAMDTLREKKRRRRLLEAFSQRKLTSRSSQDRPAHKILVDEEHKIVLEAIAELPALYREPFVLKHLENWSYKRIAEALGLPADTVETRLVRARRILRGRLARQV